MTSGGYYNTAADVPYFNDSDNDKKTLSFVGLSMGILELAELSTGRATIAQ
ncbi:hypothetical protein Dd703_1685 [Musicola paradisiaca Ech703]|uniref:Uncharacterized protein n=1 Tax=Musicola paradisiaca (strain Ech703) TaxID=579405 RepID=C6C4A8_MUSP7|nr:hypothetical protein Dd703_1685 [Musicola paradisiaca Ech703]